MAYYHSDDTDTQTSDDYSDYWNPETLLEQLENTEDPAEKRKIQMEILEEFLDQERPSMSGRMMDFLLEDGVMNDLLTFVTRLDEGQTSNKNPAPDTKSSKQEAERRDLGVTAGPEEFLLTRRSFNVTELFANNPLDLSRHIESTLESILKQIFDVFKSNSKGNFWHFHRILDNLLTLLPVKTTKFLLSEGLFWKMLDYCYETPISNALISVFCCDFPRQNDAVQFYRSLVEQKLFERLSLAIAGPDHGSSVHISDFFIKLIDKLAPKEMAGILFVNMCKTSSFVDKLFTVISNPDSKFSFEEQRATATLMRELLYKSGEKMYDEDLATPLPNMLSAVFDKLHIFSKAHIKSVCELLIKINSDSNQPQPLSFSHYTVKRPFSFFQFTLIEILGDVISSVGEECLNQIPVPFWGVLADWFFEHKHNNLFHIQFFKIVQIAIHTNHWESLRLLFQKNKFVTRMIQHYEKEGTKPGCGGFIVLICNMCRFAIQLQTKDTWLRQFLSCHDPWLSFQPTLLEATKQSVRKYTVWEDEEDEEDDEGIELGSSYAKGLGFAADAPISDPVKSKKKNNKKKKKKKNSDAPNNANNNNNNVPEFWNKKKNELDNKREKSKVNDKEDNDNQKYKEKYQKEIQSEKSKNKKKPPTNEAPVDMSFWSELTSEFE